MGCSLSGDSQPRRKSFLKQKEKLKDHLSFHYPNNSLQRNLKIKDWKSVFLQILTSETSSLNNWDKVKADLEKFVSEWKEDSKAIFVVKKSSNYFSSSTIYGSDITLQEDSALINHEKAGRDYIFSFNSVISDASILESPNLNLRQQLETQAGTLSTLSPPLKPKTSKLFSATTQKPKTKAEIKEYIEGFSEGQNSHIKGLIEIFISTWKSLFEKQIQEIPENELTIEYEEIYSNAVNLIKRFASIMTHFVYSLNEDQLEQLEAEFKQEDVDPIYLIQCNIYSFIFQKDENSIKDSLFKFLAVKHQADIQKVKEVMKKKKPEKLETYDPEVCQNSGLYLLKSSPSPYNQVIKILQSLVSQENLFLGCETLDYIVLEGIWTCISEHHKDSPNRDQIINELGRSIPMEVMFPIMIYCVVQSQCEALVIVRKFFEEFIDPQILYSSLGYTLLESSIDFLLSDEDYISIGMKTSGKIAKLSMKEKIQSSKF